jgi:ATP-binding protein involved in chromosome partitioning
VGADTGEPLVVTDPDAPASQAISHAARGLIAVTPQDIPVMQAASPFPSDVSGTALPMAQ